MKGTLGASTPDDERDIVATEEFMPDTYPGNGFDTVVEPTTVERTTLMPAPVQRSFWPDQDDPGTTLSAPRDRGPEAQARAAWPVGALLFVVGVATFVYNVAADPMAIMGGGAAAAFAVLVVDHYVD